MDAFFEQQKVCPVCQTKFTVTRVRSSACFVTSRDTDFRVNYRDIDPLLYSIWVCPECQYANSDKDFIQEFAPHELERLKKGLALLKSGEQDFSGQRNAQMALRTVELALRTAMVRQAPAIVMAGYYLRAAWLCREMGKTDEEMKNLEQARNNYQKSFEKEWGRYSAKMSDSRIMYLIGELNRRLGQCEEAVKWFSQAVMNKDIKNEPEINRLVRDQWEIAREEYKRQQAGKGQETKGAENPTPDQVQSQVAENVPPADKAKSRGSKVKMYLGLFMDQVDWLKNMSNKAYDKYQVTLEKEAVARALIDAAMEKCGDLEGFKTEEELKEMILGRFS